jgi:hypothetical protein
MGPTIVALHVRRQEPLDLVEHHLAHVGPRQGHVVHGSLDLGERHVPAEHRGAPADLLDVEHDVGAEDVRVGHRRRTARAGGGQHEHRRRDPQSGGDPRLTGPYGAKPAGVHRPRPQRLPGQVEVPLALVLAVQAAGVEAGHPARYLQAGSAGTDPVQHRHRQLPGDDVSVHVEPGRVQHDAGDVEGAVGGPQRDREAAGRVT